MNLKTVITIFIAIVCILPVFSQEENRPTVLSPITVEADDFGYCAVKIGSSTELKQVVSSVFRVKSGTYSVGVENSFRDYVDAEFEDGASSSPTCTTTIESYQDAADSRNEMIGRLRRNSWTVYTVSWAYRGD